MLITKAFIEELEQEVKEILVLCRILNGDPVFIQELNRLIDPANSNSLLIKAENFFISDIIAAYQRNAGKETDRSGFVLAYYYDALRNNHFADKNAINVLNRLAASPDFKTHLIRIIEQNHLPVPQNLKNQYILVSALADSSDIRLESIVEKIEKFITLTFGITFPDPEKLKEYLGIDDFGPTVKNKLVSTMPENDSLEKVMDELNAMIGLVEIKQDVKELINLLEIQKRRTREGLNNIEITLHTVFLGPPGTGKTTVARLLGRIFKHLGFLSKGQLCETDREGIVAGYVGQTATKVDKVVEDSIGGVLFIDEAYALTTNSFGNDYGSEAVNILIKRMEDHRDDLAVIVAGYTEPMKIFVESNPGLRSRFNRFFYFDHFIPADLFLIFEGICKKSDFTLSEDAREKLNDTFELLYAKKDEGFGNARVVRNLFEKCVQNQANRLIALPELTPDLLKMFEEEDIPEPKETQKQTYFSINEDEEK